MRKKLYGAIIIVVVLGLFVTIFFLGGGSNIVIESDAELEALSLEGSGTSEDPYVLDGRIISSNPQFGGTGRCIYISDTSAYLTIRGCTLSTERGSGIPISLNYASNIIIEDCSISEGRFGIWIYKCENIGISGNTITNCGTGVGASETVNLVISGNVYSNCDTDEDIS
ncbi:MAG: right-handed parallel beta-helix repeat-containing protein [Candidatus Thorarchaeota archaeon]|jgi:parallel beta-helix repeat protein